MEEDFDAVADSSCGAWLSRLDCNVCGSCKKRKTTPWFICICGAVGYCSKTCQREQWSLHKMYCATIPLFQACISGNPNNIRSALKRPGVKIDLGEPLCGLTPACICTIKGFCECLTVLIEHGASVCEPAGNGFSPVHLACLGDKPRCLEVLARNQADMNVKTASYNPATICCVRGHVECLYICLNSGADPNQLAINNNTAVHAACQFGYSKCLQLLISRGADLGSRRHTMSPSPIDYALLCKHPACVGLLLAKGVYLNLDSTAVVENSFKLVYQAEASFNKARERRNRRCGYPGCRSGGKLLKCPYCRVTLYCGKEHAALHLSDHYMFCVELTRTCDFPSCQKRAHHTCLFCKTSAYCTNDHRAEHFPKHRVVCNFLVASLAYPSLA